MKKPDENNMTQEEKEAYKKLHDKFHIVPKKTVNAKKSDNFISYTINILSQPIYAKTLATMTIVFAIVYSFLYGLWRIPVIDFGINRMSEVGLIDYMYLFLISILTATILSLSKFEKTQNIKSSKVEGSGSVLAAIFAGICPVCQGIQILALGSTIVSIPLAFLVPYLGLIQLITLLILGFAVYLKSNVIFTKTCISCSVPETSHKGSVKIPFFYQNTIILGAIMVLVLLLVVNSFLITTAYATAGPTRSMSLIEGSVSIKPGFEYGSKVTLKPMPLASGETPRIQGYKTIVKPLPTISELSISASTGDVLQDLVNNVIPKGTPWYGSEAGVSFDDPIQAQKLWAKGRAIQLDSTQEQRWNRIVNSFTCDYCCGSPQQPTVITRCGCAHASAGQGMVKWFIKNYGDKYSDEEIYGELARWYALWYPGPTVKRIAQELDAN